MNSQGRKTCEELKRIRKIIAEKNGIPYDIPECNHKGPCAGTCPRCESEIRYLEQQLMIRKSLGKKVLVAGLAVSLSVLSSGCMCNSIIEPQVNGYLEPNPPSIDEVVGDVPFIEDSVSNVVDTLVNDAATDFNKKSKK